MSWRRIEPNVAYMRRMHAESMEIFAAADLEARCITPAGAELPVVHERSRTSVSTMDAQ